MTEAAGVSFLAIRPEIALGLGAVLILLIDVAPTRTPGPCQAGCAQPCRRSRARRMAGTDGAR